MCFSPEADLVAAVAVGAIGIDAIRHVRRRNELPLAVLPLLFAAHQLTEAFVWWGLQGDVASTVGSAATTLYLVVALGVLPALVPFAIWSIEPSSARQRWLVPFVAVGAVMGAALLVVVLRGPVSAAIEGHHLDYATTLRFGGQIAVVYVLVTCVPLLLSTYRTIAIYGIANLVAVVVLAWVDTSGLTSLWCLWAAITSVAIASHLRRPQRERRAVLPATS